MGGGCCSACFPALLASEECGVRSGLTSLKQRMNEERCSAAKDQSEVSRLWLRCLFEVKGPARAYNERESQGNVTSEGGDWQAPSFEATNDDGLRDLGVEQRSVEKESAGKEQADL